MDRSSDAHQIRGREGERERERERENIGSLDNEEAKQERVRE
jgi:hypothetical protein